MTAWRSTLSIHNVLIGLCALSVAVALCLAAFGIGGTHRQAMALERVMLLEKALHNHGAADAFMDSIRADVLRALQAASATNKESGDAIRADLQHHIEVVQHATSDNDAMPLGPGIHDRYDSIVRLVATFVEMGRIAVNLALTDPVQGSENFEHFRHSFSVLESEMDAVRDLLDAGVNDVRKLTDDTTALVQQAIFGAAAAGVLLLFVVSALAIRIVQGITSDLASSREQARHDAVHDTLTGLPNRKFLAERLAQALARNRRHGSALAVLSLDLDRFKQINDTLGHSAGDALLRAVAHRLHGCVRACDTVARLGGDEFAIIQAAIDGSQEVTTLSQRIVETLSAPYELDGHQVVIGASVGFALAPSDATEATELLKMADIALYRAKADGRDTFRSFEPGMDAKLQARRLLELDLRKAVTTGEFELHYQPLVNLASGKVTAFEALLRWTHPHRGTVSPDEFIPRAEETGQIIPLGSWVLQQVCLDAAGWPEAIRVAVNLSAVQFKGAGLVAAVAHALASSGLQAERLELEITETALLHDSKATLGILCDLQGFGVRIAMDDFGTGYSSLGYLRSFPFDKIKIDQCFVRDMETSADCKAIVRAVTGLGQSLGIATTAEGVETREQLDQVRAEGCDEVQGYLFSRPVPGANVLAVMERIEHIPVNAAIQASMQHQAA